MAEPTERKLKGTEVLENFGTEIESARLSPRNIIQAAEEDFRRKARNKQRQAGEIGSLDFEHFAFHRKHVHKAKTPADLIGLAILFQSIGAESGKRNTRLIYKDEPVLQEAYRLAGGFKTIENTGEKKP